MAKTVQSFEESIKIFEEGVGLSRTCSKQLEEAEQKVSSLLAEAEGTAADTDDQ